MDMLVYCAFYTLLVHKLLNGKGEIRAFEPTKKHFQIVSKNCRDKKYIYK